MAGRWYYWLPSWCVALVKANGLVRQNEQGLPVMLNHFILVAAGGAIGAALRHAANLGAWRLFGAAYPWGTMGVNIVGSLVMGLSVELIARRFGASQELRLFIATGILGGFTTFSAFSLDFATLIERGQVLGAMLYAIVSVVLSIIALFAGLWVARQFA
jgi:fluoride exporter